MVVWLWCFSLLCCGLDLFACCVWLVVIWDWFLGGCLIDFYYTSLLDWRVGFWFGGVLFFGFWVVGGFRFVMLVGGFGLVR